MAGNERAVAEGRHLAAMYRRAGYPDAHVTPEYCIDERGMDNFHTYTVSVYVGEYDESTVSSGIMKAFRDAMSRRKDNER